MQVHNIRALDKNENRAGPVPSDMGRLAAAYAVVWMGCWHGILQFNTSPAIHAHYCKALKRRRLILTIGLVFPLSTRSLSFLLKSSSDNFPVFYWQGLGPGWHSAFIEITSLAPVWAVATALATLKITLKDEAREARWSQTRLTH